MGYFLHRYTRKLPLRITEIVYIAHHCDQLAASDLQTAMTSGSAAGMDQLTSMPGGLGGSSSSASSNIGELPSKPLSSTPTISRPNVSSLSTPISSNSGKGATRGLQLSGSTKGYADRGPIGDFARDLEDEMRIPVIAGGDNPWGNDNLIDINADEDDWSMSFPFYSSEIMISCAHRRI